MNSKWMHRELTCIMLACSWIVSTDAAHAETNSWIHGGDGLWQESSKWSLLAHPTVNDAATLITNGVSKTVLIDATTAALVTPMTISNLVLSAPGVDLNELRLTNAGTATPLRIITSLTISNGGVLTITNAALQVDGLPFGGSRVDGALSLISGSVITTNTVVTISDSRPASMSVHGGTWLARNVKVGGGNGSQGTLTIAGGTNVFSSFLNVATETPSATGTVWVTGGRLAVGNATQIGDEGTGQMTVSDGTVLASNVVVAVFGGAQGTLTVAGGTVLLSSDLTVARDVGSTGLVWVTGGELTVTNASTIIASSGVGQVVMSNGLWRAQYATVGDQAGSQGTLTIAGGTNDWDSDIVIASSAGATGSVWLTAGQFNTTNGIVSIGSTGVGRMSVTGGTWRAASIEVGGNAGAQGTLTIAGGTNTLRSILRVGTSSGATGTVWLTGGQLAVTNNNTIIGESGVGAMAVSNGSWFAYSVYLANSSGAQGTLTIAGGTNRFLANLDVGFSFNGTGAVRLTGGELAVTNAATTIGNSGVGQVVVSNGLWRAQTEIVGNQPGSQGTLTVAGGTNTVSGVLRVGQSLSSTGAVWVTGGFLVATNSPMEIAFGGSGQMTVSNGTVLAAAEHVGISAGSQGTLTVAGGTNSVASNLQVGFSLGATGTVWVTGGRLVVTNGAANVGGGGGGQMTVSNGTWLAQAVAVGVFNGSPGTLTVAGGTNTISDALILGNLNCTATGLVVIAGGRTFVTNEFGNAVLEVRTGTLTQSGGLLQVDNLVVTNACARFVRSGGTLIKGALVLNPALDADGDGLPNGWEQQFGLDPLVATGNDGPAGDPDGDGVSNAAEFAAGTDPVAFRVVSVAREGNDIRVTWTTFGDNMYFVQTNSPPAGGSFTNNFTDLSPPYIIPFGAGAATTNYLDAGGALFTNRYYRVRLVP